MREHDKEMILDIAWQEYDKSDYVFFGHALRNFTILKQSSSPQENTNNPGEVTEEITIDTSITHMCLLLVPYLSKLETLINKHMCLLIDK
jgi:hypothetical protein